jgi:regulator of RNase E activity RraA
MRYLRYREELSRCYSAVLMDVMDTMGLRTQCMDPAIRPLLPTMRAWGEAATLYFEMVTEVPEKPFELEMEAIDSILEGQVLIEQCNVREPSAAWGGLLTNAMMGRQGAGVVTDGWARDYAEVAGLGFPVFCRGLTPYDSLGRMDGKERNVPVICGGVRVAPGDLVYADVDGVVVVPQKVAEEVIRKAWEKVKGESLVRQELRVGASVAETFRKYKIL